MKPTLRNLRSICARRGIVLDDKGHEITLEAPDGYVFCGGETMLVAAKWDWDTRSDLIAKALADAEESTLYPREESDQCL